MICCNERDPSKINIDGSGAEKMIIDAMKVNHRKL